jgi:hypothetical protein
MRTLWELPGPRLFIEDVLDDLAAGKSAVILLPEHGPQDFGLRRVLVERVQQEEGKTVEEVDTQVGGSPERCLAEHCGLVAGAKLAAASFVIEERFRDRMLWLTGIDAECWARWQPFLLDYQHAALTQPAEKRTLFIIPLVGTVADQPHRTDIGLSVRRWDDVVDSQDMLLFAAQLLRERSFRPALRAVLAATIAQLALFDFELAVRLAHATPTQILTPAPVLEQLARERGWTRSTPGDWKIGSAAKIDGAERIHSSLKSLNGGVDGRRWRAQVGTIFPLVEQYRQELIGRLANHLQVPFHTEFGIISDLRDLEIGHLHHQAMALPRLLSDAERVRLGRYKMARNALAHHEPLEADLVLSLLP